MIQREKRFSFFSNNAMLLANEDDETEVPFTLDIPLVAEDERLKPTTGLISELTAETAATIVDGVDEEEGDDDEVISDAPMDVLLLMPPVIEDDAPYG